VLLQAGCSKGEEEALQKEVEGGKCEFEQTLSRLRLRPIAFISQCCQEPSPRHSFVREASMGRWSMLKFKHWLIGREFTWITDCSRLIQFFDSDFEATHTIQRWKLELLRFDFTITHRPAKMLTEYDMLSRYNTWVSAWNTEATPSALAPLSTRKIPEGSPLGLLTMFATSLYTAPQIPQSHINPTVVGPHTSE
jgi:hypothetical protein